MNWVCKVNLIPQFQRFSPCINCSWTQHCSFLYKDSLSVGHVLFSRHGNSVPCGVMDNMPLKAKWGVGSRVLYSLQTAPVYILLWVLQSLLSNVSSKHALMRTVGWNSLWTRWAILDGWRATRRVTMKWTTCSFTYTVSATFFFANELNCVSFLPLSCRYFWVVKLPQLLKKYFEKENSHHYNLTRSIFCCI